VKRSRSLYQTGLLLLCLALLLLPGILPAAAYSTLRSQMSDQKEGGTAIRDLQAALDSLGYPVDRDTRTGDYSGVFNGRTHNGVVGFQLRNGLRLTGMADDETQKKLYSGTGLPYSTPVSELPDDAGKTGGPSLASVQLLDWYSQVKRRVSSGQTVLIYHPRSGISYNLKVYSPGYHLDAEPASFTDTRLMNRAFGRDPGWSIEVVYARLPDGRWSLATTHNFPHLSFSNYDNGFGGHLCVHFLRDLEETRRNSGDYNVENQMILRSAWKALTGRTVDGEENPQEVIEFYVMSDDEQALGAELTGKAMEAELLKAARDMAYRMATENLSAYSYPGASVVAGARAFSREEAKAVLLQSNPGLGSAERYGLGCLARAARTRNHVSEVYYWYFLGMTQAEFAAFPGVEPPPAALPGDANNDQTVDIRDLVSVIDHIVSGTQCKNMDNADANGDEAVDIRDLVWIIEKIVAG
jgi:hypothetical protein